MSALAEPQLNPAPRARLRALPPGITAAHRPYQAFGAAKSLLWCRDPEVLLDGPAGTGKSRGCLEKVYIAACKYPGMRILIARKTRVSMTETVLVTFEEKVIPEGSPVLVGPDRANRRRYTFPNGSEIIVAGLDNTTRIMSAEYDLIYVAEATELTEADWEDLTTRLRNGVMPYQQIIGDCNPTYPTHWANLRCNRGATTRLLSRHEDNPTVTDAYLGTLRNLSGVRRARLYEGRWAAAEGTVFDRWDPAIHLIDRIPIPASWTRERVIDFGYTNPFVCNWIATDPDGRGFLYRSIYMTQRLVSDHADDILRHSEGERIDLTIADHDAEGRATLNSKGIPTVTARKEVQDGIQAVQERLRPAGDGKPRFFILRDSLVEVDQRLVDAAKPWSTEQEFDGYVWAKAPDGRPVKEEPLKVDDHGMDTIRYWCINGANAVSFGVQVSDGPTTPETYWPRGR